MHKVSLTITAASMALAGLLVQPVHAVDAHSHPAQAVTGQAKTDSTKAALRDLWIGHVFWVRNVVVAALAGDAVAQEEAEKQVVGNAQAIAASIEPFYGVQAREKLFALLARHYGAVKAYLDASIAKNAEKQTEAITALTSNAGEIASFLSSANEYLPKDAVEGLLKAHGAHHIAQIQQFQAKDYAGEARTWAVMTQHIYVIADAIADALVRQFPTKV